MKNLRILFLTVILLSAMLFSSCSYLSSLVSGGPTQATTPAGDTQAQTGDKNPSQTDPQDTQESTEDPNETEPIVPTTEYKNPLTGLPVAEDISDERALAFVIDNSYLSVPQDGIGSADILCEFSRKDGTTTLMAIYKNHTDGARVGPLGKASKVMLDVAAGFDAIAFSASVSETVKKNLSSQYVYYYENPDLMFYGFFEDPDRKSSMGYRYCIMGEGVRLFNAAKHAGARATSTTSFASIFNFYEGETEYQLSNGKAANNVYIPVSPNQHIQLVYSVSEKMYYRYQFGTRIHTDGLTGEALSFTNLFLLTGNTDDTNAEDEDEISLNASSRGTGYFACFGKYVPINWVRGSDGSFRFYTTAGAALEIPAGQSYMAFLSKAQIDSISYNYGR